MSDVFLDFSYPDLKIELPYGEESPQGFNSSDMIVYAEPNVTGGDDQVYSFSAAKLKQLELIYSSLKDSTSNLYTDDSFLSEYFDLVVFMNQNDLEDFTRFENQLNLPVRSVADEVLLGSGMLPFVHNMTEAPEWAQRAESYIFDLEEYIFELMQEKETCAEDIDQCEEVVVEKNIPQFQIMVDEHLHGFGEKRANHWEPLQEDQHRKRRLCRHFLKGYCKRGKACDFHHDLSIFCPNTQKVFLGGLPAHITEDSLLQKLAEQGYNVINRPKVLRGFTPQVCMASVEEARRLIRRRKIAIDGTVVDVRPYEAFARDDIDKKFPDDMKRSVFLGGLSKGTTSQVIKDDLDKLDVKVVNYPLIKSGFTPKVTLGSVEQTNKLINMKKVRINGTLVDVRPYVNSKSLFYRSMN